MEKNIVRTIVIVCTLLCFGKTTCAQTLTKYERERFELADKTIAAMGEEDISVALSVTLAFANYIEENGDFEDKMMEVYFMENMIEALGMGYSVANSLGAYESWHEYSTQRIFKTLYQDWKRKRATLDKTRTPNDIKREKNRLNLHEQNQRNREIELQKKKNISNSITMGDKYMTTHNYVEAKQHYTQALQLSPNDSTIMAKIASVDEAIAEEERIRAEEERLRQEAEKKARREAEEQQVQMVVEDLIKQAFEYKRIGQLEMSAIKLQQALDTTAMHNYNYKASEMSQLLDTIRDIQTSITDTSKFYDYKMLRPDLYNSFDSILSSRIKAFMYNRGKNMRRNHISVTFYSDNTPISFQIEKPSRELKNLCKNSLFIYKPQPLKIDGHSLKANAAFDYDFEYAKGKVKVHKKNNYVPTIDIRYKVSPQLEAGIKNRIVSSLDNLNYECWGDYILYVTSADVNGHMKHNIEFKRGRFINGPQNAWKSLILPGWGDKYVDSNKKFDWWKTVISYGATATGTGIVVYNKNLEGYRNTYYDIVGYGLIAIGVGQWLYDIIHVGVQGAKNKKEAKSRMGMYLSYDASHNAPEMGYSFSF